MKRFYKQVSIEPADAGFQTMLDGRGIKTVTGSPQVVPTEAMAKLLADEWDRQGEKIEPSSFVFRDMADYAIDVIAADPAATIDKLLSYAETDTLCYRADPEDALFRKQCDVWEPLLAALEQRHGIAFTRISGIVHRAQPDATLLILRKALEQENPFILASLEMMASLSASLSIALLALDPAMDADTLWDAASLEEEWQAELWGRDEEAEERRAKRRSDFANARSFALSALG